MDLEKSIPSLVVLGGLGLLAWYLLGQKGTGDGGGVTGGDGGGGGGATPKSPPSGNNAAVNPGPNVGTGTPTRIVESGSGTPITYWPAPITGTIGTSGPDTSAEAAALLAVINTSYLPIRSSAWWTPAAESITNPAGYSINLGGSPQSNIPAGTKHCAGPGPGAPATDTWHVC